MEVGSKHCSCKYRFKPTQNVCRHISTNTAMKSNRRSDPVVSWIKIKAICSWFITNVYTQRPKLSKA